MLDGKGNKTVQSYLYAIAHLAEHFGSSPDRLSENQVREYLLLRHKQLALNSMRPVLGAMKFFYSVTLPRDWPFLTAMRLPRHRTVPKVLVPEKCWKIILAADKLHLRAALQVAYTCGLRNIATARSAIREADGAALMKGVAAVLKRYGGQYIERYGQRMTAQQKKVLRSLMACREERLGTIRYRCACCGHTLTVFVPEQVLEALFKKQLRKKLQQAGLLDQVPAAVWQGRFVVNSQAIGSGKHALAYLAPYVTRGCVSNWRVTACDEAERIEDASLTLQVKRSGTRRYRGQRISVTEFIRRFLLHVLPSGFHRIRHYGFLNTRSKRSLEEVRLLIAIEQRRLHDLACTQQIVATLPVPMTCPQCGGPMACIGYDPPPSRFEMRLARSPPTRAPPSSP